MCRALPITAAILCLTGCSATRQGRPYLDAALRAASWIQSVEQSTGAGKTWPADPENPGQVTSDLYAGSAGVVLFFLEAYATTGDVRLLSDARAGADDLLARIPENLGRPDAGLYTGAAGMGFALLETHQATGDERYRAGVERVVKLLRTQARESGDGIEWSDVTDIIGGSAGTGLFLLRVADELDAPQAGKLAIAAGRRLVQLGQDAEQGKKWAMSPSYDRLMPNFSHGTAGIAYFLATLYQQTGEQAFLDAAVAGARYLQAVAKTDDGGCLVFHHEPGGEDLFYLGWCHGPVGTARLFYRLAEVTGDPEWMTWVRRCARSLITSGIPEGRTPGYWNNVGQCCGAAGVAQLFIDLYRVTGERQFQDFAIRITADLLDRATRTDGGLKWAQAEHRVRPELLVAQTGYMQGAAGIGLLFLHLDAVDHNRQPTIVFPDTPFE
jgi:lantibiotic modifying enzyme